MRTSRMDGGWPMGGSQQGQEGGPGIWSLGEEGAVVGAPRRPPRVGALSWGLWTVLKAGCGWEAQKDLAELTSPPNPPGWRGASAEPQGSRSPICSSRTRPPGPQPGTPATTAPSLSMLPAKPPGHPHTATGARTGEAGPLPLSRKGHNKCHSKGRAMLSFVCEVSCTGVLSAMKLALHAPLHQQPHEGWGTASAPPVSTGGLCPGPALPDAQG